jgi:hypothetical protein
LEFPNKSLNLGKQTILIMRNIIKKFKESADYQVLLEMSNPKIILGAVLFNICAFVFMYGFLDLLLYIHYDL